MIEITAESSNIQSKVCIKCEVERPLDQFTKSRTGKYGRHNWCRECLSIYNKIKYKEAPAEKIERAAKWNQEHPNKVKKYKQNWWLNNSDVSRRNKKGTDIPDKTDLNF